MDGWRMREQKKIKYEHFLCHFMSGDPCRRAWVNLWLKLSSNSRKSSKNVERMEGPRPEKPLQKPYTQTRDLYTWNSHLLLMFHSSVSVGVLCNQPDRPQSRADGVTIQIIPKDAFGESSDFGHTEHSPYFQQIFLHVPRFWPVTLKAALILSAPDQWNYMTNV